jgi:hypothetical protein
MGVYIIKSVHSNWIKLGHHKITHRRPSVYYRFINRGFYSVICPSEIKDAVSFHDLILLYWFENLDINDEKKLHEQLRTTYNHVGEWYKHEHIDSIVNIIYKDYKGVLKMPTVDDYNNAIEWSKKMNDS